MGLIIRGMLIGVGLAIVCLVLLVPQYRSAAEIQAIQTHELQINAERWGPERARAIHAKALAWTVDAPASALKASIAPQPQASAAARPRPAPASTLGSAIALPGIPNLGEKIAKSAFVSGATSLMTLAAMRLITIGQYVGLLSIFLTVVLVDASVRRRVRVAEFRPMAAEHFTLLVAAAAIVISAMIIMFFVPTELDPATLLSGAFLTIVLLGMAFGNYHKVQ